MKRLIPLFLALLALSCGENRTTPKPATADINPSDALVIAFASCNHQDMEQPLWEPILENEPDLFVWGGDNIYSDTEDMQKMRSDYEKVKQHPGYQKLREQTKIIGTWDDHDYGLNDGGKYWEYKEEAKALLLDFLDVPKEADIRNRAGVYFSHTVSHPEGSVKIILLDTRSFRDSLLRGTKAGFRYEPWGPEENKTLLGEAQWQWLENELLDDTATFTMIVSSIQFLSNEHGWEKWGNFPNEVQRFYNVLENAKAKNVFLVSGDRHLGEISVNPNPELSYPLVDFTTSGLTHTYLTYGSESNEYRVSNIIKRLNFGILKFNFEKEQVTFELRGEDNFLFESYAQQY